MLICKNVLFPLIGYWRNILVSWTLIGDGIIAGTLNDRLRLRNHFRIRNRLSDEKVKVPKCF